MLFLDPIYCNSLGTAYLIKDSLEASVYCQKIQLLIGDAALMIEEKEIATLLNVVQSVKKGCPCENCQNKQALKQIKCDTGSFTFVFKSDKRNIVALEDLLLGTIFELQMHSILDFHDIE
jgi:cytidine deaminase